LVDPGASPQQRTAVEKRNSWWNALAGTVGCLLAAVVIGAVMVGIRFLLR
jgi:hypothetical protein